MRPAEDHSAASLSVALRAHWPEYLMEAGLLAGFLISACAFATLLEHPDSPVHRALPDPLVRRVLMGLAMGATAVVLIHSPWGRQSGAHMNPALTLTFLRLGKVARTDALFYVIAQFAGGLAGVLLMVALIGRLVAHPSVHHVATTPGRAGAAAAFAAELVMAFVLMFAVLHTSNRPRWIGFTPLFAAALIALFISLAAPISGMSLNPARSFGSAVPAGTWTHLWIYFVAPPLGMLLAAEAYLRTGAQRRVFCAKLHHQNAKRCIFCVSRAARNAVTAPAVGESKTAEMWAACAGPEPTS